MSTRSHSRPVATVFFLVAAVTLILILSCGRTDLVEAVAPGNQELGTTFLGITNGGVRIERYHDEEKKATCWIGSKANPGLVGGGGVGLACIPDIYLIP